jgi:methylmalonyl-CoA/ethylmalonyl-CoA epimerase
MSQNLISSIGPIMQLAFVPDDFDAALAHWTKTMGAGPFFWVEHAVLENKKFEGQPSEVDFGLALGYWGDMQIELIKQHNEVPSIYRSQPYRGSGGIHHVCLLTDNIATAQAKTEAAGGKIAFTADAGDGAVFYAHTGGAEGLVEVLQMGAGMQDFFDMIKAASIDWDGSDPLRG